MSPIDSLSALNCALSAQTAMLRLTMRELCVESRRVRTRARDTCERSRLLLVVCRKTRATRA